MKYLTILFLLIIACSEKKDVTEFTYEDTATTPNTVFAIFPPIPDSLPNKSFYERIKREFNIPNKSTVGIPAYPNSWALTGQQLMDLKSKIVLPSITLASSDSLKKVQRFYQKQLPNWKFDDQKIIFWNTEDKIFPQDNRNFIESVFIKKSTQPLTKVLLPTAQTEIIITYLPKK